MDLWRWWPLSPPCHLQTPQRLTQVGVPPAHNHVIIQFIVRVVCDIQHLDCSSPIKWARGTHDHQLLGEKKIQKETERVRRYIDNHSHGKRFENWVYNSMATHTVPGPGQSGVYHVARVFRTKEELPKRGERMSDRPSPCVGHPWGCMDPFYTLQLHTKIKHEWWTIMFLNHVTPKTSAQENTATSSLAWWWTPVIPAAGKWRLEAQDFRVSLDYIASSKLPRAAREVISVKTSAS